MAIPTVTLSKANFWKTRASRELIGALHTDGSPVFKTMPYNERRPYMYLIGCGWEHHFNTACTVLKLSRKDVENGRKMTLSEARMLQEAIDALEGIDWRE